MTSNPRGQELSLPLSNLHEDEEVIINPVPPQAETVLVLEEGGVTETVKKEGKDEGEVQPTEKR